MPVLFCFLVFPVFRLYSAPLTLSLDDVIERAVNESISLQKNAIDLELAGFRANNLWSELFPSFSLSGSFTFLPNTQLFTDPGFNYNTKGVSYSLNFGITMQFNVGIPYSMQLTQLAYRKGLLDFENAKKRVVIDATKIFYTLLANQFNIRNLQSSLELAERLLEKNRIARENGLIGELPWLQSRLSVETARYNLTNASASYENTLKEFLSALGLSRDTEVELEGSIETSPLNLDSNALIQEFLPKRPDIVSQLQVIERLELSRTQNNMSSKAPSLSLSATWSGSPQNGTGMGGKFTDSLSGRLSLSVPIDPWIPGTRSNQSLRAADNEVEKARLDLVSIETSAKTQIHSLTESLKNSWRSIEIARLRMEIAKRTYELSDAGFQNGVVEYLNLENTRNDFADAQFRLLQSEVSYFNLLLDLASALNVDLETLQRRGS